MLANTCYDLQMAIVGRNGGNARARKLSPERRREIATKAAQARWKPRADPRETLKDTSIISSFCIKHGIVSLFAFGSVLRSDFNPKSDIDLLYVHQKSLGYFERLKAVEELEKIFGRKVDLVNKGVIESSRNEFRRAAILGSAEKIYQAKVG